MLIYELKTITETEPLAIICSDGRTVEFYKDRTGGKLYQVYPTLSELVLDIKNSSHLYLDQYGEGKLTAKRYITESDGVIDIVDGLQAVFVDGKPLSKEDKQVLLQAVTSGEIRVGEETEIEAEAPQVHPPRLLSHDYRYFSGGTGGFDQDLITDLSSLYTYTCQYGNKLPENLFPSEGQRSILTSFDFSSDREMLRRCIEKVPKKGLSYSKFKKEYPDVFRFYSRFSPVSQSKKVFLEDLIQLAVQCKVRSYFITLNTCERHNHLVAAQNLAYSSELATQIMRSGAIEAMDLDNFLKNRPNLVIEVNPSIDIAKEIQKYPVAFSIYNEYSSHRRKMTDENAHSLVEICINTSANEDGKWVIESVNYPLGSFLFKLTNNMFQVNQSESVNLSTGSYTMDEILDGISILREILKDAEAAAFSGVIQVAKMLDISTLYMLGSDFLSIASTYVYECVLDDFGFKTCKYSELPIRSKEVEQRINPDANNCYNLDLLEPELDTEDEGT